ncbi:CYTH domain-containing protein [Chroococcus sp. FPU101]|uniref:CYTH domain-containing protein n=1 Tax=Chroococcus sp. FPU101 TaxID=1974212 RepID=UPI001A8C08EF|nr:CYTH domain-containing protein [Chroococcus sp. FPU101]GFE68281.1 putative adenylate cyclase [Chroococcus sp. FPU101]
MATEIERKFLVKNDAWKKQATGKLYRQGYIATKDSITTVRIRIAGEQAFMTIKGKTEGIGRAEFEYEIPLEDAQTMLDTLCDRPLVEKVRYKLQIDDLVWEIDEFLGENEGLIMAEVELKDENQTVNLPDWVGDEVSHDARYYNVNLAKNPYRNWKST